MGQFKERLTTAITAELGPWCLKGENGVIGYVYWTSDRTYIEGAKYFFANVTLIHYPFSEGHWQDHFLMKTQTGTYFMLKSSVQVHENVI